MKPDTNNILKLLIFIILFVAQNTKTLRTMGRKPPLGLDIDEKALLDEMFGGDFEKLAKEKKEKREVDKAKETSEIQEKNDISRHENKSNPKTISSDFVERLITTHSQWDNSKRILIDSNLNNKLKRLTILFKIAYSDKDKYITVRNLINNILHKYISSQKELENELMDVIRNKTTK